MAKIEKTPDIEDDIIFDTKTELSEAEIQISANIEKLIEFCKKEREYWAGIIMKLTEQLKDDLKNNMTFEAEVINYKQLLLEVKQKSSLMIVKLDRDRKRKYNELFEYYSTEYQIKATGTQVNKLIEGKTALYQERINILELHVNYLSSSEDNLKTMCFSLKNKIEIYKILALD